jgi:hypothetical protein
MKAVIERGHGIEQDKCNTKNDKANDEQSIV